MRIYAVGGAVRDELLGLPVKDRDYVVVGATPEEMQRRGFRPVGRDFPVFLHPLTQEEYALARTERKSGRGYKGFTVHAAPDVTLEQDLERRDLTINAMARDEEGNLIDPYGGLADLRRGLLRHVGPAFAEDPVRILRVARLAARYGFAVDEGTRRLMEEMVAGGEADALVAERVWQEFARGLLEEKPARMLALLAECGLLARIMPELGLSFEDGLPANDAARIVVRALEAAARGHAPLAVRYAVLASAGDGAQAVQSLADRFKVPNECRELAVLWQRHGQAVSRARSATAAELLELLSRSDAFRRPERFSQLVDVCEFRERGARGWADIPYAPRRVLGHALAAAQAVDAAAIARAAEGRGIPARLSRARRAAIAAAVRGDGIGP